MADDVTLSNAVRDSLLSLKDTTRLIDTTQGRLSTGLRVAAATDDPVSFFQAKTLSDRAFDFGEKKDAIDQGISTVETAIGGIEAVENIVRQIKGVAGSLKSATGTQFTDLISQFNSLRTQIGTLTEDTTFQGLNLVNGTNEQLVVSFSAETASVLTVDAVNITQTGLGIEERVIGTDTAFNYAADANFQISTNGAGGEVITVTYQGTGITITGDGLTASGPILTYGTVSIEIGVSTVAGSLTLSAGDVITITTINNAAVGTPSIGAATTQLLHGSGVLAAATGFFGVYVDTAAVSGTLSVAVTSVAVEAEATAFINEGDSAKVDVAIAELDTALTTLRSNAQTLGSNVALLQTRLDFTESYVNNLEGGAAKLTLADLNEEGANLLALQTRQQLGISALAFAGQAEQGILSLFR